MTRKRFNLGDVDDLGQSENFSDVTNVAAEARGPEVITAVGDIPEPIVDELEDFQNNG